MDSEKGPGGMSLRDYFAGQAIIGIITRLRERSYETNVNTDDWSFEVADAYLVADWMLEARLSHETEKGAEG